MLITALSVPFLKERVGPRRWTAIGIGLLGVLVVLRPTGEGVMSLAGMAVLLSALGYAISAITVRLLAKTDSVQSMMVWLLAMMAIGAGALAYPDWVPIQRDHWPLIAFLGVAGAFGQYAITLAFKWGEASLIAPLEYTALVWGVCLDLFFWGVLPDRSRGSARRSSSRVGCTCCAARRCTRKPNTPDAKTPLASGEGLGESVRGSLLRTARRHPRRRPTDPDPPHPQARRPRWPPHRPSDNAHPHARTPDR